MKVLFFSKDETKVEQLVMALRMRWPDLVTLTASRGSLGLQLLETDEPALAVLCGDLVDVSIWSVIAEVRSFSDVPLIVVIEREGEMEVVKALELGADDFISLPCNMLEVTARVAALVRRVGISRQLHDGNPVYCGDLLIDPAAHEAYLGSTRLDLTPTEFRLLHLLARNRHVTLSQQYIGRVIWTDEVESGQGLKKYIQRLRRKLGDDARDPAWIKTVRGVGYRFSSRAA